MFSILTSVDVVRAMATAMLSKTETKRSGSALPSTSMKSEAIPPSCSSMIPNRAVVGDRSTMPDPAVA